LIVGAGIAGVATAGGVSRAAGGPLCKTGSLTYIQTPNGATVHYLTQKPVAPLYLVVYPKGFVTAPGSPLNCVHLPMDNCPDHGNAVAAGAEAFAASPAVKSSVYTDAGGVAGHDHLIGVASTGGDFNVIWEPVIVVFKTAAAVHRITTLSDLNSLLNHVDPATNLPDPLVSELPLPSLEFHCSVVSAAAYNRGTPAPSVAPVP
jgi:hypothetical protein